MVSFKDIEGLSTVKNSKGKVSRPYINISKIKEFYITNDKNIAKIGVITKENGEIDHFEVYNDHDDTSFHVLTDKVFIIKTDFSIITCIMNGDLLYFAKQKSVNIYA
jgi:ribosomal protein S4E